MYDDMIAHIKIYIMKRLFIASLMLLFAVSCETLPEEVAQEAQSVTIEFAAPDISYDDAKAVYDAGGHKLQWVGGDQIGCFAEGCTNIRFTNTSDCPTAFTGKIVGSPQSFWFYFPYQTTTSSDPSSIVLNHPSEQNLLAGTFGTNPPMAAQCSASDLTQSVTFHNAGAIVKFNVTSDVARTLVKAEFKGNGNEILAGSYTMDIKSATPVMKMANDGKTVITMNGTVEMQAKSVYSFIVVVPPATYSNGFTVKLTDADGFVVEKVFDNGSLTIARNKAINLSSTIEFNQSTQVAPVNLLMNSLTFSYVENETTKTVTFNIDEDNLIAKASKTGFTDPRALSMAMTYTATAEGKTVTPTITLDQEGGNAAATISRPSSFTANLTVPRTITMAYGDVVKTYTIKLSQLTDSGLPVVYVNTPNGAEITSKDDWMPEEPDDDMEDAYYSYIYIDADGRTNWDGTALSEFENAKCYVKGRGNTTWNWDKKPYAFKLDKKVPVLGMAKHKRWVLLANKIDKTMVRNILTFMIAADCYNDGAGNQQGWNPTGQSVELVLNGVHKGNYLLCEQIKIDSNRINITESKTPTTSTSDQGYLLEGDRYWGNDPTEMLYWTSYRSQTSYAQQYNKNFTYMYGTNYHEGGAQATSGTYKFKWGLKSPDDGDLGENGAGKNTDAYKWINERVTDVEDFIFNTMTTSTPLSEIAQYIHIDSFINYWLVFEMAMNQEPNNPGSCYMYYDNNDGLFHAGPVWDFDWGTYNYSFTDDDLYTNKADHFIVANSLWYCRLLQNTAFQNRVSERWAIIKPMLQATVENVNVLKSYLEVSASYNWNMWTTNTTDHGDPNGEKNTSFSTAINNVYNNAKSRITDLETLISNKRYK